MTEQPIDKTNVRISQTLRNQLILFKQDQWSHSCFLTKENISITASPFGERKISVIFWDFLPKKICLLLYFSKDFSLLLRFSLLCFVPVVFHALLKVFKSLLEKKFWKGAGDCLCTLQWYLSCLMFNTRGECFFIQ